MNNPQNHDMKEASQTKDTMVSPFLVMRYAGVTRQMFRECKDRRLMWMMIVANYEFEHQHT